MSPEKIVIGAMALFALLGAMDRILGGRFGLGEHFEVLNYLYEIRNTLLC